MTLTPREVVDRAVAEFAPVAIFVGFSGGRDSLAITHWMMNNVPGCKVFHVNTGIGIERTREYVRETCAAQGWPLTEIRAKEDCGQDYDELVKERGFPGPDQHRKMYDRLKGRCVEKLVRDNKKFRSREKVMIASGVRRDESKRRMGYGGREINQVGAAQVWVNPIYHWTADERDAYNRSHGIAVNPVSAMLGMSGECLCGAYAHKGEKALVRLVCPQTAARIDKLELEVLARGFTWAWDAEPPRGGHNPKQGTMFMPMCVGCEKTAEAA